MKLMSRLAVVGVSIVMGTSAFAVTTIGDNQQAQVGTWAYVGPGAAGADANGYMYIAPGSAYAYQGDGAAAADTNSTAVTERTVALESTKAQIDLITEHLDTVAPTPIAAGGNSGGSEHRFNVFAKVRWDKLKDNFTNADWNADLWTGALGGDYKFNDYVTAGLAFTYSHLKGDTKFNNGKIKDNAWGFVPYIRVTASDMFSFDLYAGYTRANKDRTRKHDVATATAINNITYKSSPKSDRYFFAAYANAKHKVQQFNLLGRLGIVHVEDRQKAFNETGSNGTVFAYRSNATKVTQAVVRAQAGFQASEYVEPYIFLTYGYTFSATKMRVADSVSVTNTGGFTYKSPNSETTKHQIGGGLGLNMNINKFFSAKVEGNLSQAKKTKTYGATAGVIYKW